MFCKSLLDDRLLDSCSFFHSSSFRISCASSFSSPTLSSLPSPFSSPTSPFLQLPPLNFALPFLLLLPPSLFPCLSSSIFQRIRLCLLPHHSVCLSFSVFSSFFSTSVLIYTLSFILTTLRFRSFFSNASYLFILLFLLLTHFLLLLVFFSSPRRSLMSGADGADKHSAVYIRLSIDSLSINARSRTCYEWRIVCCGVCVASSFAVCTYTVKEDNDDSEILTTSRISYPCTCFHK